MKKIIIYVLCVMTAAVMVCCRRGPEKKLPRPNVIVILVDALRADRLGCYGHGGGTSPFLDSCAKKGVLFTHAYSHSSHTKISVAALFTGLIPPSNGIRKAAEAAQVLSGDTSLVSDVLPEGIVTMAERFKQNGYATCGIITNPHLLGSMGFGQGFDDYVYLHGGARAVLVNRMAMQWLRSREGGPFFLYLHYMDVHAPYTPPPEYARAFTMMLAEAEPVWENGPYKGKIEGARIAWSRALYDAEIKYWDDQWKQFEKALERAGALENTVVVILSDHGEEFYDHGGFGHGYTCYDEVIHVPLIIRWPGRVPGGVVRPDLAAVIDVYPTLAALAGIDVSGLPLEGRNLFADGWDGTPGFSFFHQREIAPVYSETCQGKVPRSLRTADLKVIFNQADGSIEAYRTGNDPEERDNIPAGGDGAIESLATEARRISHGRPVAGPPSSGRLDAKTVEELRSIGYVGE